VHLFFPVGGSISLLGRIWRGQMVLPMLPEQWNRHPLSSHPPLQMRHRLRGQQQKQQWRSKIKLSFRKFKKNKFSEQARNTPSLPFFTRRHEMWEWEPDLKSSQKEQIFLQTIRLGPIHKSDLQMYCKSILCKAPQRHLAVPGKIFNLTFWQDFKKINFLKFQIRPI